MKDPRSFFEEVTWACEMVTPHAGGAPGPNLLLGVNLDLPPGVREVSTKVVPCRRREDEGARESHVRPRIPPGPDPPQRKQSRQTPSARSLTLLLSAAWGRLRLVSSSAAMSPEGSVPSRPLCWCLKLSASIPHGLSHLYK